MKVNYIKQLESVSLRMADDTRLNSSHVSMYLALFLIWNHHRFENPLSINRTEVMKLSKIGARATYHKCLTELHKWEYLKYMPSHNPLRGSLVNMFIFDTTSEPTTEQVHSQLSGQLPSQVLGSSINNLNNRNNKTYKTRKSKTSFALPELDEENAIELLTAEGRNEVNTKARTGSSNSRRTSFQIPELEEVISFFKENGSTNSEGENFFNYFSSNGWLVGGKAKMKDWNAAARNWIKRSANFKSQSKPIDRLNTNNEKDYSMPL